MELIAILTLATLSFITSGISLFVVVKLHIKTSSFINNTQSIPVKMPFSTDLGEFSKEIFEGAGTNFNGFDEQVSKSKKIREEDLV